MCDVLFSAARSATLSPRKEVPSLIRISSSRPADIFLVLPELDLLPLMSVLFLPLQQLTLLGASTTPDYALSICVNRKQSLHHASCEAARIFHPEVAEALGGWCDEAVSLISSIGNHLVQQFGLPHSTTIRATFSSGFPSALKHTPSN